VQRKFERSSLDVLWVTDITEHPSPRGQGLLLLRARHLQSSDCRLVNRLVTRHQSRRQCPRHGHQTAGLIAHVDHGVQFTFWSFTERIRDAGLMPSFGSIGDAFDNAMMESFWPSMQDELFDRKKWHTRLELTNAIFDYIEVSYNRQRRHSSPTAFHRRSSNGRSRKRTPPDFKTGMGNKTQSRSERQQNPEQVKLSTKPTAPPSSSIYRCCERFDWTNLRNLEDKLNTIR